MGRKILAYGRDPNFPGWPDTLQLNYANPELHQARIDELIAIAGKCDGIRCDMAMLLLPEIFQRTWGIDAGAVLAEGDPRQFMRNTPLLPLWPRSIGISNGPCSSRASTIATTSGSTTACGTAMPRRSAAIWSPGSITRTSSPAFSKITTSRAPRPTFPWPQHQAAAIITYLSPGLRFFYQGQFEGARVRVPTHLCRGPVEPTNPEIADFYAKLLRLLKETARLSRRRLVANPAAARPGPAIGPRSDFVAYAWAGDNGSRYVIVVNNAANHAQCRLPLPFPELQRQTDTPDRYDGDRDLRS